MSLNFTDVRKKFPAIDQTLYSNSGAVPSQSSDGRALVYLDSAATALKPQSVVDVLNHFYSYETANVHRGAHRLSARATEKFEHARHVAQRFLNAKHVEEIVFTKGTTESLNLLAQVFSKGVVGQGDEIILTEMEHHSNIVPWQNLAQSVGAKILWVPVLPSGDLDLNSYRSMLNLKTKLVCVTHCSNVLGTINDIEDICREARKHNALVVVDAAQSVSFLDIDVQKLDCDFLAFSGHKIYGPYGIGVLYGKIDLLNSLSPYQFGGAMISEVSKSGSTYLLSPQRFEAGTPNISGAIGLGTAIEFLNDLGLAEVREHSKDLLSYCLDKISDVKGISVIGDTQNRVNLFSFISEAAHASDISTLLDQQGIAVRSGHHCAMPLMRAFNTTGTVRVSFGVYNNYDDVDFFINALNKSMEMLR